MRSYESEKLWGWKVMNMKSYEKILWGKVKKMRGYEGGKLWEDMSEKVWAWKVVRKS